MHIMAIEYSIRHRIIELNIMYFFHNHYRTSHHQLTRST